MFEFIAKFIRQFLYFCKVIFAKETEGKIFVKIYELHK